MLTAQASSSPSLLRRAFFGAAELRSGWRLLIFFALIFALRNGSSQALHQLLRGADTATVFLVNEILDFLFFFLASWIMGRLENRNIATYGLPWRRMFRFQFWQGFLLGFASITVLLLAMRGLGVFHFAGVALHGLDVWKWGIVYTLVFSLVALREEFRDRGYALFTLSTGVGFWPAALISAAYFGYSHHTNSGENWIGLCNAGLFGLFACVLLRRTGDLWMPIGAHMAFDWGETYFYGVADSGNVTPGHLLNTSSSGPFWLSGGTVGPEGSVLCTAVLVIATVACTLWLPTAKYPQLNGTPPSRTGP
jgi:membrane protease YdiL (CAAX protease family)